MGKLRTDIIGRIDEVIAGENIPRLYLGMSEIGTKCQRALWYRAKGYHAAPIDGRTLRLFDMGNLIEDRIIAQLTKAGYFVDWQQKDVTLDIADYGDEPIKIFGHIDGIVTIDGEEYLLEIKSASDKNFNALVKSGYEKWNAKYKAQIHAYMILLGLDKCLAIVENKNDSNLYIEEIAINTEYIVDVFQRVAATIKSETPPPSDCPTAAWFEAKLCGFCKECFR